MYRPTSTGLKSDLNIPAVVILVLAVTSCAGSGSNSSALKPIDAGTRVKVSIDDRLLPISEGRDATDSIADGAIKGGAQGALIGAGTGVALSLFCGSLFLTCAEVFVAPMTVSGVGAGATIGAIETIADVESPLIELSPEAADIFSKSMAEMDFAELQNSIRDEFLRQSDGAWLITEDQPTVNIILGLESLYMSQLDDGDLFLITRMKLQIEYAAGRNSSNQELVFSHSSDSRSTDEWFEDNGAPLQPAVDLGIEKTIRQVMWALRPLRPMP